MGSAPESVWTRAARTGEQERLNRDRMVAPTVALLDAHGLEGVTMRRVATELGVTVGALYWHVAGRDQLLELALDAVLGSLVGHSGTGSPAPDWRDDLAARAHRLRSVLLAHPWAVGLLGRLPNTGPHAVAAADALLAVAGRAGFPSPDDVLAALHDHVVGAVVGQQGRHHAAERYARPRTVPERGGGPDIDAACDRRFEFGLGCLLDGLAARL